MAAKTKKDVEQQSAQDRLWESLENSYGQQREASEKAYDQAIAQTDRQALSRGMQRSSYNNATLANLQNQKVKASNDIASAQIADYQNRLTSLEQQEKEDERWERQFEAQRDDSMWNRAFQQNQADRSQANWQAEYNANRSDAAFNQGMQQQQFAANREDTAWNQAFQQKQFDANQDQNAWQRDMTERQYSDSRADAQWNQNFQQQQFNANQEQNAWQRSMTERQYADSREDTAYNRAFQQQQYNDSRADNAWQQEFSERQWQTQQDQWREQFDYNKMTNDQKVAFEVISAAVGNGQNVSDDILQRAGISRDDFNSMKTKVSSGGSGSTPEWKQLGYKSATDPAYLAYLAEKNRQTSDGDVEFEPDNLTEIMKRAASYNAGYTRAKNS